MKFRGDERGAAIQIGAVILFAFIVIAMASYQATVVPDQNSGVEFNHNQDVQSQMVDLTTGIDASARDGTRGSHSVRLGTTYPSRTFFVNPGSPGGQLRTVESGSGEITLDLDVTDDEDSVEEFWEDSRPLDTSRLQYEPNYNEYSAAPRTVYEYGTLFNENPRGSPTELISGGLVDDGEITLVTLRGNVQAASSSTVSVDRRALSSSSNTVTVEDGIITLPIENDQYWSRLEAQSDDIDGADVTVTADTVEIEIVDGGVELRLAQVGVGDVSGVERDSNERATYVVENNDRSPTVSAEIRDAFNNPVAEAQFKYEVNDETVQTGTTNPDGLAEVEDVEEGDDVRIWIADDNDWEIVDIKVQAGSGSGGGGSDGAYDVSWATERIADENAGVTCSSSSCTITDDADKTFYMETDPSVDGASVEYSSGNQTYVSFDSSSGIIEDGEDDVNVTVGEDGETNVFVSSGGGGDRLGITVEIDETASSELFPDRFKHENGGDDDIPPEDPIGTIVDASNMQSEDESFAELRESGNSAFDVGSATDTVAGGTYTVEIEYQNNENQGAEVTFTDGNSQELETIDLDDTTGNRVTAIGTITVNEETTVYAQYEAQTKNTETDIYYQKLTED